MEGGAPPLPGQPRVAGSGNERALPFHGTVRTGGRTSLSHDGEAFVNVWLLRQTCFFRIPYVASQRGGQRSALAAACVVFRSSDAGSNACVAPIVSWVLF